MQLLCIVAWLLSVLFISKLSGFFLVFFSFSAICDSEPEQPVRNCPLWVKVEGEVDPEPIYIPTPSVIEPVKSVVPPNQEVLPSSKHRSSSGAKPSRVYTPKPNPVVREKEMCLFSFVLKLNQTLSKVSALGWFRRNLR